MELLQASLGHGGTVGGVLGREGVGRPGREDDIVGFDRIVAEHVNGRTVDGGDGASHDLASAQEVRVGHEDGVLPHGVDGGAQGGRVMDELVLLLDEDDVREGIEPLATVTPP